MDQRASSTHDIIEERHVEIAMPDGCILAARIWRPADAAPVPAILEYLPYRKGDGTLARDTVRAPYIAARGYAYVRVDLRGTGESEGLMVDEYTEQELQDGCDAIAWIAAQGWCDGNVGMVGISWGGFNGLQIAALQPPALKAVVSIASTDDRYADDVHYMGGTMVVDQISWASHMFAINTLPPDPDLVGDKWREMWMQRLRGSGLWLKNWLEHQRRDDFWKHGSVCEDISRIQVPVYAVSGWADGYCRTVFRLMETLKGPKKGIVGPWSHKYPHAGVPGPAIDWATEELRWWDQWLKGVDTGIMDEPQLRLYMQDHAEPASYYTHRDGRWIEEPSWPSPNVKRTAYALGTDGSLGIDAAPRGKLAIESPLGTGIAGGKWCSYAAPGDQPVDQRRDDAGSMVFETASLDAPLEIAGDANLELTFSVDQPVAQVAARLVDVAPNGSATRVSYGLLNLTHRDSHETPEALVPGEAYTATVPFKHVAQTFRAGHRLRLSLSTSYFPVAWPAPEPVKLTVDTAKSQLVLPVRKATDDPSPRDLGTPKGAAPMEAETLSPAHADWVVTESLATGETRITITDDSGRIRIADNGISTGAVGVETYSFTGTDWRSFKGHVVWDVEMSRGDWQMTSRTETEMTATATHFIVKAHLAAKEGDRIAHEQNWDYEIPRDWG
ncbi:MAG: CocE/NonD family hydrolase [Loktanella sp.]|nr:CocE/NonD family hydrolase [Loktanella sp.]